MPNIKTAWKQALCERGVGVPRLALRKHSPNFYCQRCHAIFPNQETLDQYIQVQVVTCPRREYQLPSNHQQGCQGRQGCPGLPAQQN